MNLKKKDNQSILQQYVPIVDSMAQIMGADSEVLLHDVTTPSGSVIACRNAYITGRSEGSPMTALGLQLIKADRNSDRNGVYNYIAKTKDGRRLKCNVIYIRDPEDNELIGMICINTDVTRIEIARNLLDEMIPSDEDPNLSPQKELRGEAQETTDETFFQDLDDVWANLLNKVKETSPGPFSRLSPEERERIIETLDNEGFFMIKGAIDILAKEINKSRYTIYADLRRIRERRLNR